MSWFKGRRFRMLKPNEERFVDIDVEELREKIMYRQVSDGHIYQADQQPDGSWIVTDYGEA